MKYLSAEEIRSLGILQEVNRLFFHPLGLAAQVNMEDGSLLIQDHREDPEGVYYAEGVMEPAKRKAFVLFAAERHRQREGALGYVCQPEAQPEP